MSDLFDDKNISPVLLCETQPFDDEDYIYELKPDGIRCIAYLGDGKVVLQNKRYKDVTALFPCCTRCTAVSDGARFWTASWSCFKTESPISTHCKSAVQ